jgi:DNA-binding winged helix-turn-helix (wHTH) protein
MAPFADHNCADAVPSTCRHHSQHSTQKCRKPTLPRSGERIPMTDRFTELFGKNLLGIRKLLRLPPSSQKLPVVGSDNSGSLTVPSGRELFVLAVPVELRDLLYAQLFELQDRERHAQVDRKRVRFAEWEFDLLDHCLVTPKGNVARLPGLEYALLKTFVGRPRHLLSRNELAILMRRQDDLRLSERSIDTYVSRLRRRLSNGGDDSLISTVRKMGYCFDADVALA